MVDMINVEFKSTRDFEVFLYESDFMTFTSIYMYKRGVDKAKKKVVVGEEVEKELNEAVE